MRSGVEGIDGTKTVLVLEQNDIHLTNVHQVIHALLETEKNTERIADEVYLVMTCAHTFARR